MSSPLYLTNAHEVLTSLREHHKEETDTGCSLSEIGDWQNRLQMTTAQAPSDYQVRCDSSERGPEAQPGLSSAPGTGSCLQAGLFNGTFGSYCTGPNCHLNDTGHKLGQMLLNARSFCVL